ncbi:MAG: hypothetical protein EPO68_17470 [Planctomycetota bacterium]|nr:MAG: hypothetical protein EPO68_17470 [Planctomycetota bacterium]
MAGPVWESCFEFEQPGDSHHAHAIRVVLLDTSGRRYELTESESDRRGESLVALTGRIAVSENSPTLEAAELTSPVALRLRVLRGESRER